MEHEVYHSFENILKVSVETKNRKEDSNHEEKKRPQKDQDG